MMKHGARYIIIALTAAVLTSGSAFAGGLNFGPIQAISQKVDEFKSKKLHEAIASGALPEGYDGKNVNMQLIATIGTAGTGNGEFQFQSGTDYTGLCSTGSYLYVCDKGNHRVQIFDSNNNFVAWFGTLDGTNYGLHTSGVPNAAFDPQGGPTISPKGHIFVKNSSDKVIVFDSQGIVISTFSVNFTSFSSYCADANDNLFIGRGDYIEKYDISGTLLTTFGGFGSANGRFNNSGCVIEIAIDSSGNVYVNDRGNNRIQKFDNNGNFLAAWDFRSQSWLCYGLAIDENDGVYIGNGGEYRKFSVNGIYQKYYMFSYYSTGTGSCIRSNKLYTADVSRNRILIFSFPGN